MGATADENNKERNNSTKPGPRAKKADAESAVLAKIAALVKKAVSSGLSLPPGPA